jgi:gas vesicle protein
MSTGEPKEGQSRRQFVKKAAYVAPAVVTLRAVPSFASSGSNWSSAAKEADKAAKDAAKEAKNAAKDAAKEAKNAVKDAVKEAKEAAKDAAKRAKTP